MSTTVFALRQGDVMLRSAAIPADANRVRLRPLALGEKTGHHHSLTIEEVPLEDAVEMYEKDGEVYVRITGEGVTLQHQEHKSHAVAPGDYAVVIQKEETDWGARQVAD